MKTAAELVSLLALLGSYWLGWHLAAAHTVLTYPGWRGNNLISNDTFPHGMQWMYPCELKDQLSLSSPSLSLSHFHLLHCVYWIYRFVKGRR
jgi:hypothetical protein